MYLFLNKIIALGLIVAFFISFILHFEIIDLPHGSYAFPIVAFLALCSEGVKMYTLNFYLDKINKASWNLQLPFSKKGRGDFIFKEVLGICFYLIGGLFFYYFLEDSRILGWTLLFLLLTKSLQLWRNSKKKYFLATSEYSLLCASHPPFGLKFTDLKRCREKAQNVQFEFQKGNYQSILISSIPDENKREFFLFLEERSKASGFHFSDELRKP